MPAQSSCSVRFFPLEIVSQDTEQNHLEKETRVASTEPALNFEVGIKLMNKLHLENYLGD